MPKPRHPTFRPLTEAEFPPDTVLFREGDDSHELYVLLAGSVTVSKTEHPIAVIDEPGAYFGEMSSLLGCPRTATITTREQSTLLVVPPEQIADLFGNTPQVALHIATSLARRLSATTRELAGHCEWQGKQKPE